MFNHCVLGPLSVKLTIMQIDSPASIVDLFKANSRPRTKLIVQMIPPGISEDEFKELIREYMDGVDYFVYKPGKISRDS